MTVDERTQELLAVRIGMLMIQSARLQAEHESLAAASAAKESNGAQGADVSAQKEH